MKTCVEYFPPQYTASTAKTYCAAFAGSTFSPAPCVRDAGTMGCCLFTSGTTTCFNAAAPPNSMSLCGAKWCPGG